MIHFFFYNNLCNLELVGKITQFYSIKYGYIYVKLFDKEKNKLYIEDDANDNTNLLKGILVSFHTLSLSQIINKLSQIDSIKYKNRESYKLKTINVFLQDTDPKECEEAYIIY